MIARELTFARVRTALFLPFGQLAQVVQSDRGLVTHSELSTTVPRIRHLECPAILQVDASFPTNGAGEFQSLFVLFNTGYCQISNLTLSPSRSCDDQTHRAVKWKDALPRDVPVVHSGSWSLLSHHFFLCLPVQHIPGPSCSSPCFILCM